MHEIVDDPKRMPPREIRILARAYAGFAVILPLAFGAMTTMSLASVLLRATSVRQLPNVVGLSSLHVIGPTANALAAVLALAVWCHDAPVDDVPRRRGRAVMGTFSASLVGMVAVVPLTALSSVATACVLSGVPWSEATVLPSNVRSADFVLCMGTFLSASCIGAAAAWVAAPALARSGAPRVGTLGIAWLGWTVVRMVLSSVVALAGRS